MKIQIFDKTSPEPYNPLAIIYVLIFLFAFILGLLSKLVYRDFIYLNDLNDFGLADSLPNFFAALGISFATLSFSKNKFDKISYSIFINSALSMIAYEFSQIFLSGVFDIHDIIASIVGSIFAFGLYKMLTKVFIKST
jgi:glycopeptide antibiotics resistance protein